jgi:FkbM family methyltransferase
MKWRNKINGVKEIWRFDNHWQLVLSRLFFPSEKINIYRFKGLEILEDHSAGDANGAREVLTSPMYRQFLALMNLPGEINVLDLGTNNGGFPLLLKSENIQIKKLVCVEFNPQTFSRMRFNIERNFDCEFIGLNVAVCGENKEIEIALKAGSTDDSIYSNQSNGKTYRLRGLTFDEIFRQTFAAQIVDLCKIDVEGAEFEILGGLDCQNLKYCRYLLMEIHHDKNRDRSAVMQKLNSLGFEEINGEDKRDDERHYVHFFINRHL